jgi:hypothetical protein
LSAYPRRNCARQSGECDWDFHLARLPDRHHNGLRAASVSSPSLPTAVGLHFVAAGIISRLGATPARGKPRSLSRLLVMLGCTPGVHVCIHKRPSPITGPRLSTGFPGRFSRQLLSADSRLAMRSASRIAAGIAGDHSDSGSTSCGNRLNSRPAFSAALSPSKAANSAITTGYGSVHGFPRGWRRSKALDAS